MLIGIFPPDVQQCLGPWPGLDLLTPLEFSKLEKAIKGVFLDEFISKGELYEKFIADTCPFLLIHDVIRYGSAIEKLKPNRRNSLDMFNVNFLESWFGQNREARLALEALKAIAAQKAVIKQPFGQQ